MGTSTGHSRYECVGVDGTFNNNVYCDGVQRVHVLNIIITLLLLWVVGS